MPWRFRFEFEPVKLKPLRLGTEVLSFGTVQISKACSGGAGIKVVPCSFGIEGIGLSI